MTSEQLQLAPVHRNDPATSVAAARKVKARRQLDLVVACLYDNPEGLTDDELAERLGLLRNSAGTRRGKARDLGLVEACGKRTNDRGNDSTVWRLNAHGREWAVAARQAVAS